MKAVDAASALAIVESGASVDYDLYRCGHAWARAEHRTGSTGSRESAAHGDPLTSGYTQNAIVHGGRLDAGVELIAKPYTREQLGLKVAQVLADSKSPLAT